MRTAAAWEVLGCWVLWAYPFIFRAPHGQKRASITAVWPTRIGLLLECAAIFMAFFFRLPEGRAPGQARLILALLPGPAGVALAWSAVAHLGRQFRITAGLWEDHELVRTGAYSVVRHPIYASLLALLAATLLRFTAWPWTLVSLALFVAGTEIRVHAEERLLAARFPDSFPAYRARVAAYIPLVR
jgi:protein-S-isoprenylcysteine O-methyltransferase Ste14